MPRHSRLQTLKEAKTAFLMMLMDTFFLCLFVRGEDGG